MYINLTSGIMKKLDEVLKEIESFLNEKGENYFNESEKNQYRLAELKNQYGSLYWEAVLIESKKNLLEFKLSNKIMQEDDLNNKLSDCCGVELVPDCDICPKCKEHC